jgi:uncharacterized membrane protein
MKNVGKSVAATLLAGVLAVAPVYLAVLLLLKAMDSLQHLVKPLANLLPDWVPAEHLLSLTVVLLLIFAVGLAVRSATGRSTWERMTNRVFSKIPGYSVFKGLTKRLAGDTESEDWKPVLAEIEEALVPGFIIEELADGRLTVFVPSVPTPLAGTIYILTPNRVHRVNVPFTSAIRVVSRWGSGSKELVAAMEGDAFLPDGRQSEKVGADSVH